MSVVVRAVVLVVAVVGGIDAFLATPLNTSDPDVVNILCPDQTTGVTRDHKWITREAIRRNLRQFFLDYPPVLQPDFNVPTTASLTELYHAYYGKAASPARFIKAVNSIAASNVRADSVRQLRYDPTIQADAETFDELQFGLSDRYPQILTSIMKDEAYAAARSLLGLSLHSLQKFYAHSTWIEQGNSDIIEGFGLPGFVFENTAMPGDEVCTPCSSSVGGCTGNVIIGKGITMGYYEYVDTAADSFLVPKPPGGKCSHGGVLDDSAAAPAEGGINKDTASPCFSPHYHLHSQAAELAVQATDHYFSVVLDAVGNDKYRRLFDLYSGSALSIVMDTTGSMGDDISAVQEQVAQIVAASSPELFILVPYNDPGVGPLTKTDDADVFMAAVNSLYANGGGDGPEMFWQGLQMALAATPDYGNVFCFTDAAGKDGDIMESVIALAEGRNIKVTIVYSGPVRRKGDQTVPSEQVYEQVHEQADEQPRLITYVPEYQRLADSTGGLFIPSGKFEISEITPILGDSVESSAVDITVLKQLTGSRDIDVPIDDSIFDFMINLAGYVTSATLKDITGTEYDLMDEAGLEANPSVDVIAYSGGLRVVRLLAPRYGLWSLHLDATSTYSVAVTANSTLAWLGDFSILDPSPPHPHYRSAEGRPLTETVYYLSVALVGYLESNVVDVTTVEYVDKSGSLLRTIPYHGEIDYEFYIRSEPLPEQPFYIKLYGHVQSGNVFCRLASVLITPVQASVEVLATSDDLAARPGDSASGEFLIKNFGLESDFSVTGTDDMKYLTSVSPSSIHLVTNGTGVVTAHFKVPGSATPGTVSTVMVTAQSLKQTTSVNSAVTQFLVLPLVVDHVGPTCELDTEPDCDGFTYSGICSQKNYTFVAYLQDTGSGLSAVYARPDGFGSEVGGFTPGTTSRVSVTFSASCCKSQVDVIGVDTQGNVGKCHVDMGVLGGYILNLEAESVGESWVNLRWEITPTALELHKYQLLIDDDFSEEFRCFDATCYRNVTYLDACSVHTFQLTPVFRLGEADRSGEPAFTDATTLDTEPGAPYNGRQTDATLTSATVEWDATNTKCTSMFEVCYRPFGFEATKLCERTTGTTYELRAIEACATYEVTVKSLSPAGHPSQPLVFYANTDDADPERPRNVMVDLVKQDLVTITWDDPLERIQCIDRYLISYGEVDDDSLRTKMVVMVEERVDRSRGQHYATISPLLPCTNYTIDVAAMSITGKVGPNVRRAAATLEDSDLLPVDGLQVMNVTETSLGVKWQFSGVCLDHFIVCYFEKFDPEEFCVNVTDNFVDLLNLLACTTYTVTVTVVSPSGFQSNRTFETSKTLDIRPGEPVNLTVLKVTEHSVDISYDPPTVNPQCTVEYDIEEINLAGQYSAPHPETHLESVFYNLDACSAYELRVRAVSEGGLASDWVSTRANTTEDAPSIPQNLQLRSATETTFDIIWFAPEVNPTCVAQYLVEWTDPDGVTGSQVVTSTDPASPLPFELETIITGLTQCTKYTITVTVGTDSTTAGAAFHITATTTGCKALWW